MLRDFFIQTGQYFLFLKIVFKKPEKWKIFWKQFILEADKLIVSSVVLVSVISVFIGGVLVIQTASNMNNPFLDRMLVGYMVRESLILEFCSTMVALILAGKIGSNIASELGSMRITEQIDAIEMMGVNSASFLVLPKVLAVTILSPLLVLLSFVLGICIRSQILLYGILRILQLRQDVHILFHDIVHRGIQGVLCEGRRPGSRPFQHQVHSDILHPDPDVRPDNHPAHALLKTYSRMI